MQLVAIAQQKIQFKYSFKKKKTVQIFLGSVESYVPPKGVLRNN